MIVSYVFGAPIRAMHHTDAHPSLVDYLAAAMLHILTSFQCNVFIVITYCSRFPDITVVQRFCITKLRLSQYPTSR